MPLLKEDLERIITWSLIRASRRAERVMADVLAPEGLTPQQFGVLAHLSVEGPMTQAALADAVLVRPQSAATLLDGMEVRGLIRRTSERRRGLRNPLELSAAGESLLAAVWELVLATNDLSGCGIDADEAAALNSSLHRFLSAGAKRPGRPASAGADGRPDGGAGN